MDESLLREFLTEAGELIESLDTDLVELESDPKSSDLLDSIFRALHTIKGAASFLALTDLIEFAHAAEDALNRMRKGEVEVDEKVVDVMLRSVDVIRGQLEDIGSGEAPRKGPGDLLASLRQLVDGPAASVPTTAVAEAKSSEPTQTTAPSGPLGASVRPIDLPSEKIDVLPFMADDLRESLDSFVQMIARIEPEADRSALAEELAEPIGSMRIVAEFFEFEPLERLLGIARKGVLGIPAAPPDALRGLKARLEGIGTLLMHIAGGIDEQALYDWDTDALEDRVESLIAGEPINPQLIGDPNDPITTLELDGIRAKIAATIPTIQQANDAEPAAPNDDPDTDDEPTGKKRGGERVATDQTVRVEVDRLEALMNLVGEMVLAKNQVLGLARTLGELNLTQETHEAIGTTASDLDRLTSELQMAVMRTRMQPLNKLFGKYSRLVRDLGRKTTKKIELVVTGGDTEVDKSVLELLADPMVHILRNSVDHGLELPDDRVAAGKSEHGTITVAAQHQGGHVCVRISDDGRGINAGKIGAKAIERGITTQEQVDAMNEKEIFKFIFAAGFSTAEQVSDLSGRGVGMDVVRTNVNKLGGDIEVDSVLGQGTTIEILIPLTVAILPAMMVGVGRGDYAIPIASIHEIVGLRDADIGSISKSPVMRLRDEVLPLIDLRTMLGEPTERGASGFAVVVQVGQERVGLMVDRLVGQREVVIKPLEDEYTVGGPFSGATIREDGDVSLILDVVQVVRIHQSSCHAVARKQGTGTAVASA